MTEEEARAKFGLRYYNGLRYYSIKLSDRECMSNYRCTPFVLFLPNDLYIESEKWEVVFLQLLYWLDQQNPKTKTSLLDFNEISSTGKIFYAKQLQKCMTFKSHSDKEFEIFIQIGISSKQFQLAMSDLILFYGFDPKDFTLIIRYKEYRYEPYSQLKYIRERTQCEYTQYLLSNGCSKPEAKQMCRALDILSYFTYSKIHVSPSMVSLFIIDDIQLLDRYLHEYTRGAEDFVSECINESESWVINDIDTYINFIKQRHEAEQINSVMNKTSILDLR